MPSYAALDFNVKNNTQSFLFVNGSSGNVGVATTAPRAKLEVVGTGSATGTAFQIDNNLYNPKVTVLDNGNVGVGTTLPQASIEIGTATSIPSGSTPVAAVKGNLVVDGYLYGNGSNLTGLASGISGLTTYAVPRASSATTIVDSGIYTDANGNVGIGTTAPVQQLEVASNGSVFIQTNSTNNGVSGVRFLRNPTGFDTEFRNESGVVYIATSSNNFVTTTNGFALDWNGNVGLGGSITTGTAGGGADLTGSKMVVLSSGNVGVGTTVPVARLQVGAGTSTLGADLASNSALIKGNLELDGTLYGVNATFTGNLAAGFLSGDGSSITNVGAAAASSISFSAKVNEAGGITKGQVVYISGATGQFPQVSLSDNTSAVKHEFAGIAAESKTNGQTILIRNRGELSGVDTSAWNEGDKLYVTTSGSLTNVAPTSGARLHVAYVSYQHAIQGKILVTTHQESYVSVAAGEDIDLRVGDSAGATKLAVENYNDVDVAGIYSNGQGWFSGNLGVGTTAARARLEVVGVGSTTGTAFQIDDSLYNPKVTVLDNGNVGIGTMAASQLLTLKSTGSAAWDNGSGTADVGFSRISPNVIGLGAGIPGDATGALQLRNIYGSTGVGGLVSINNIFLFNGSNYLALNQAVLQSSSSSAAYPMTIAGGNGVTYSFPGGGGQVAGQFQNIRHLGLMASVSGTVAYLGTDIAPTFNTTGTFAGTLTGLRVSPYLQSTAGAITTNLFDVGTNTAAAGAGVHTSIFVVNSVGNVGIGTIGPRARLEVVGASSTTGTAFQIDDSLYNPKVIVLDNGNVGVGTTTPQARLEIGSAASIPSGSAPVAAVKGNLVVDGRIYGDGSALTGIAASSQWSGTAGSAIYYNSANVGIGSATPQAKLEIVASGSTSGTAFQIDDSIYNPKVTVLDNGNVGIGTTMPGYQLDVINTLRVKAVGRHAYLYIDGGSADSSVLEFLRGGSLKWTIAAGILGSNEQLVFSETFGGAPRLTLATGGNIGVGTSVPVARLHVGVGTPNAFDATKTTNAYIAGDLEVDGKIYGDGSGLTGVSSANSSVNVVPKSTGLTLVDSSIYVDSNGNVGIATTSPSAKLNVKATVGGNVLNVVNSSDFSLLSVNTNGSVVIDNDAAVYNNAKLEIDPSSTGAKMNWYNNGAGNRWGLGVNAWETQFYMPAAGHWVFNSGGDLQTTGSNEILRIMGSGNVGIATVAPRAKLEVVASGSTSGTAFQIDDNLYNPKVTVLDNGKVGIGTTNPGFGTVDNVVTLFASGTDVKSAVEIVGRSTTGTNELGRISFHNTASAGSAYEVARISAIRASHNDNGILAFYTHESGENERMRINQYGNLGVGTTNPLALLQVGGGLPNAFDISKTTNAYIAGDLEVDGKIYGDASGLTNVPGGISGLTTYAVPRASSSTTLIDSGIYLAANGNVGIGSTVPQGKLEVEGSFYVDEGTFILKRTTVQDVSSPLVDIYAGALAAYNEFSLDSLGNLSLNPGGQAGGGNVIAYSKVNGDALVDLYTASLDRGAGTGGVGLGLGYLFRLENSAGSRTDAGRFKYVWTVPTAGAETSVFTIQNKSAGSLVDALVVNGANVGIGSAIPRAKLEIVGTGSTTGTAFQIDDNAYNAKVTVLDNGNVGIGTSIPAYKLHLSNGEFRSQSTFRTGVSGEPGRWRFYDSSGYLMSFWITGTDFDTWGLYWDTSDNEFRWMGNGTLRASIDLDDGSGYYQGNLGIGTTAPVALLQVGTGTPTLSADLSSNSALIKGNLEVDGYLYGNGSLLTGITAANASVNVVPKSNGSSLVDSSIYVDSNGNVGIGTTLPLRSLTVGSDSAFDTGSKLHVAGPLAVWVNNDTSWPNTRASANFARTGDNYFLMTQPGSNTAGIGLSATGNNFMFVNQNGPIQFKTGVSFNGDWNTSGTVGLTFATSGNVGVGTVGPRAKLEIVGSGSTTGTAFQIDDNLYNPKVTVLDNGYVGLGTTSPNNRLTLNSTGTIGFVGGGNVYAQGYIEYGAGFVLQAGSTSSVTQFQLGYGGASTTGDAGQFKLDVPSSISSGTVTLMDINPSFLNQSGTAGWTALKINPVDGAGSGAKYLLDAQLNGVDKFVVTSSGNVGIGTVASVAKLEIVASGSTTGRVFQIDDNLYNPKVTILDNGNVGVGTVLPGSTFDVKGSIAVSIVSKSSNYAASVSDRVILVDASGGNVTITLPNPSGMNGRLYDIKKTDSSANALIVNAAAGNVDGGSSVSTSVQNVSFTLVTDGTNWWVI